MMQLLSGALSARLSADAARHRNAELFGCVGEVFGDAVAGEDHEGDRGKVEHLIVVEGRGESKNGHSLAEVAI